MCRFLLVKSLEPIEVGKLLTKFAYVAKNSRTTEGDWQGDGWGVSWLRDDGEWKLHKSLNPIWEEVAIVNRVPETRVALIHARSASFERDKGKLEYNQPYIAGKLAYVFNGLLKGVKLNEKVEGDIGAQKIFSLIRKMSDGGGLSGRMASVYKLLKNNSIAIKGFNIGLADASNLYALSDYMDHPEYFNLRYFESLNLKMICSEEFGDFEWKLVKKGRVIKL